MVLQGDACIILYIGIATLDRRDLNMYLMQSIGRTMGIEHYVFILIRTSYIKIIYYENHRFGNGIKKKQQETCAISSEVFIFNNYRATQIE